MSSKPKTKATAVVVCPGRGTYTKTELGSLLRQMPAGFRPTLDRVDGYLRARGRPTVSELDGASAFSPSVHTKGENASTLIWACSMADFAAIDPERVEVVAVTGNSMGWYTALACAGALPTDAAIQLVHTMGSMMQDGVIGGQLVYPVVDSASWRLDPARLGQVETALREVNETPGCEAYLSIRFGGYAVMGANEAGLALLRKRLPPVEDGKYPLVLVNHAAFHTPLLTAVSERAGRELPLALFGRPTRPLVDGTGRIWQPWSTDAAALREYTLGHQVVGTYDFTAAVEVALKEFAPDLVILLGPGASTGGAIGQILVGARWDGLADKQGFSRRQEERPLLVAMGRPEQRPLVALSS